METMEKQQTRYHPPRDIPSNKKTQKQFLPAKLSGVIMISFLECLSSSICDMAKYTL